MPKSETPRTEEKNSKHWGKPWKKAASFPKFAAAAAKRNELLQDPELQVKVKYRPLRGGNEAYEVRTRLVSDGSKEITKAAFQPEGTVPNPPKPKGEPMVKGTKRQQTKMKQQAKKIREDAEEKAKEMKDA